MALTDAVLRLSALENSLGDLPEVDGHRVEEVRQAIENGNYDVDAGRIADKLLKTEDSF